MPNINGNNPPIAGTTPPTWAVQFNTSFSAIDGHDHSDSKGLSPIDASAITFTNDFSISGYLSAFSYTFIGVPSTTPSSVYTNDTDLFSVDGLGSQIQITELGTVKVITQSGGGFSGDYTASGALATYNSITNIYTFTDSASVPSSLVVGVLNNIQTLFLPPTANITNIAITAPQVFLSLTPPSGGTNSVVRGSLVTPGNAAILAPYLAVSASNTTFDQSNVGYITTSPPATFFAYGLFTTVFDVQDNANSYRNVLQIALYPTRTNLNTTAYIYSDIEGSGYTLAAMGGAMQSVPTFTIPTVPPPGPGFPPPYTVVYTDNVTLVKQDVTNTFNWNPGLTLSLSQIKCNPQTGVPLAPFGGP